MNQTCISESHIDFWSWMDQSDTYLDRLQSRSFERAFNRSRQAYYEAEEEKDYEEERLFYVWRGDITVMTTAERDEYEEYKDQTDSRMGDEEILFPEAGKKWKGW